MQSLWRDIRYGLRSLRKSPGLTTVAILTLALGIGLTTMMFSIVYGTLFKGLPFPDGDRIMVVQRTSVARGLTRQPIPIQDYVDLRDQQHSFTGLGAFTSGSISVTGDEKAERFDGSWITANTFDILSVRPMLGRAFRTGEDSPSGEKVAILSYSMWRDRYRSDSAIVGRRIRINGVSHTVVGVMPEHFAFPINDRIWLPLQTDPNAVPRDQGQPLDVFGKLKPATSLNNAAVDVSTIAARLAAQYKNTNDGFGASVQPFTDSYVGNGRRLLLTMLGAVLFVLLIACTNVANLLLDRAAHRSKEVGIRTALGASRGTVVRQFLTESLLLSAGATVLGVGAAQIGVAAFNRAIAGILLPFFIDVRLHPQVLVFTILIAAATTLLAGVIPALQSSRIDINEVLKDEARGASSFRAGRISRFLVTFEVALSCSLLVASGLMIKSITNMRTMDRGFTTANVFTARLGFPSPVDTVVAWQFFDQLLQRAASLPGVQSVALSSALPAAGSGFGSATFAIESQTYADDKDLPRARAASVTPAFFDVIRTPTIAGRKFTDADREGAPAVAIVNLAFVKQHLGSATKPIGQRIRMGGAKGTDPWLTIVGVVGNTFSGNQDTPMEPSIFRPMAQARSPFVYITAKTAGSPVSVTQGMRDIIATLNNDVPLFSVRSFDDAIAQSIWFLRVRIMGTMFMIFGFIALVLGSVGLYAVMSFSVSRRSRELGIRMALGARGADVVRMILGQATSQLIVGITIGLLLASAIGTLLRRILFQVDARDPLVFGGVSAALALVGLIACLVPVTRATRVDPVVALRSE